MEHRCARWRAHVRSRNPPAVVELPFRHWTRSRPGRHRRLRRQVGFHARPTGELFHPSQTSLLVVRRLLALACLMCAAPLAPVAAQRDSVQLDVVVPQSGAGQEGPTILVANLLADSKTRELLRNGFTTQIHFRLELWRR